MHLCNSHKIMKNSITLRKFINSPRTRRDQAREEIIETFFRVELPKNIAKGNTCYIHIYQFKL
jgi:hypothetical protein